jgi:hypothetical protein
MGRGWFSKWIYTHVAGCTWIVCSVDSAFFSVQGQIIMTHLTPHIPLAQNLARRQLPHVATIKRNPNKTPIWARSRQVQVPPRPPSKILISKMKKDIQCI